MRNLKNFWYLMRGWSGRSEGFQELPSHCSLPPRHYNLIEQLEDASMSVKESDTVEEEKLPDNVEEREALLEGQERDVIPRSRRRQHQSWPTSVSTSIGFILRSVKRLPWRMIMIVSMLFISLLLVVSIFFSSSLDSVKAWAVTPGHSSSSPALDRLHFLQQQQSRKHLEEEVFIKNLGKKYDLEAYHARLKSIYQKIFASEGNARYSDMWAEVEEHLNVDSTKELEGIPHFIISSARNTSGLPESFQRWQRDHPTWNVKVYNDSDIDDYIRQSFPSTSSSSSSSFYQQWLHMPYPILRIDTFRYFKIFFDGGVYSDSDTGSLYSVEKWPGMSGSHENILEKGDSMLKQLEGSSSWTPPQLVLAVEYDAPGKKKQWKEIKLARPLQITQFAFLAAPFHPVLLDCLGTIMEYASEYHANPIPTEGTEFMDLILDWTGPGLFTDAVYRFLIARHGVDPFTIAGLDDRGARIGNVLVYPEFAFGIDQWHHLSTDFELVHHGFLHRWIDHFYDN